jgi:hypothetical protein
MEDIVKYEEYKRRKGLEALRAKRAAAEEARDK